MIYTFKECINKYNNQYQLEKAIDSKEVYKIEDGIYSDQPNVPEIAVIAKKYPNAVLTGDYAYYYYNFTDVIPLKYSLATKSKSAKINDKRVHQIYVRDDIFDYGLQTITIEGYEVRIYNKERMLVELLRNKNTMPYDMYKEILLKYRLDIQTLQFWKVQEYSDTFPKSKMIKKALSEEIL